MKMIKGRSAGWDSRDAINRVSTKRRKINKFDE